MYGIVSAIVLLGVLIFVHELGHFLAARKLGVRVTRFSLGFGPKIAGVQKGDTEYVLSAIPLGGYVKMVGEDIFEEEELSEEEKKVAFSHQPVWVRTLIVVAGPFFNLLFAAVVLSFVYLWGTPVLDPVVGSVMENTPAATAGIQKGDLIVAIDGKPVDSWDTLSSTIHRAAGKQVTLTIKRKDKEIKVSLVPEEKEITTPLGKKLKVGMMGVVASGTYHIKRSNPFMAVFLGVQKTIEMIVLTLVGIVKLIQRVVPWKSVGGPILIFQMAKQQAQAGLLAILSFAAFISVNLGIINLFPIPVLDGGHLLFLGIEKIMGRPPKPQTVEWSQKAGIFLLITLMVLACYNDILRIVGHHG